MYRQEADDEVYSLLQKVNAKVTGNATVFNLDRPVDTLRARLMNSTEPVQLSMLQALDVAAENSFGFQQQKERLYLSALTLTQRQNDFAIRWGGGGSADISGTGDDEVDVDFSGDLSASVRSVSGTQIVFGFVNNLMRSLVSGGGFDGSSILSLTLTQPLLRGAGEAIVREPLTQAEKNLVYAVRDFEQFRRSEAVRIIDQYLRVAQAMRNLQNLREDLDNRQSNFLRAEALFGAGRGKLDDVDRAEQDLLSTRNAIVSSEAGLESSLDSFKQVLGLPTDSQIDLDESELDRLEDRGVTVVDLEEERAIELALSRRYDYQTTLDNVDDAARNVIVAEDALKSILDFSSAITVPTDDPDESLSFDWTSVRWSAGFDLDLAIDKLSERNAYRSALISLDVAIRAREQAEDQIKAEIRADLRDIQENLDSYDIDVISLTLAERRVASTQELYDAGRVQQIDVNDAQDALIASQLRVVGRLVSYYVSRLQLMNDLEALMLEPRGLRFDPGLPLPQGPLLSSPNNPESSAIPSAPGPDVQEREQRKP
jgi:outer membrane protein TolC